MIRCNYEVHSSRNDTYSMERPHFHEDVEITLCTSGEGIFFLEPEIYPMHRGQLFLIVPATLHRSVANDSYRSRVLRVPTCLLEEISTSQSNFANCTQQYSRVQVTLDEAQTRELEEMYEQLESPGSKQFGNDMQRFILLMAFLVKSFSYFVTGEATPANINMELANMKPVIKYIQAHLAEELSLDSIAAQFFISKFYLCRNFKLATGFSVRDYIIHCRILRARALLRNGYRVQETGELVGFHNNEHFIRTFKKLTGVSPKRYAKEYLISDKDEQSLDPTA
ncbi:MAG: AraC family transcriptional regulator [Candidatus Fimivivens sp.]|nr:AraC family transcriptional regulator [Candidatus Fimivivens sp.]